MIEKNERPQTTLAEAIRVTKAKAAERAKAAGRQVEETTAEPESKQTGA